MLRLIIQRLILVLALHLVINFMVNTTSCCLNSVQTKKESATDYHDALPSARMRRLRAIPALNVNELRVFHFVAPFGALSSNHFMARA